MQLMQYTTMPCTKDALWTLPITILTGYPTMPMNKDAADAHMTVRAPPALLSIMGRERAIGA